MQSFSSVVNFSTAFVGIAPKSDAKAAAVVDQSATTHKAITFDYPTWGLAEQSASPDVKSVKPLLPIQTEQAMRALNEHKIDLEGFKLTNTSLVEHYRGKTVAADKLALVRFEREDKQNTGLAGEHISATINLATNKLIGLTRMQAHLTGDSNVAHQVALDKAVAFLKQAAPDLMPASASAPVLTTKLAGDAKMDFEDDPKKAGNIEIHWIGGHTEDVVAGNDNIKVHGMKVKMYIPSTELWAWVVVDKEGDVQTFERNIFWNFTKFKRETQMWLHDKWLDAQKINLPAAPAVSNVQATTAVTVASTVPTAVAK